MNYAEMSGYEINNRLHNAIACKGKYDLNVEGYKVTWTEKATGRVIETLRRKYDKEFKDYLSSWADAGPIIQGNKITILTDETTEEWSAAVVQDFCDERAFKFSNCCPNPLRAAMITFLMMQEEKCSN